MARKNGCFTSWYKLIDLNLKDIPSFNEYKPVIYKLHIFINEKKKEKN